jgi:hypothetical protein
MSATTATLPEETTSTTTGRGFSGLPCPLCGEPQAATQVTLNDLEGSAFHCCECDADFGIEDVRNLIANWSRMLDWVESVPQFEE